jgi:hypothetical protein
VFNLSHSREESASGGAAVFGRQNSSARTDRAGSAVAQ